jgi:hypothetical protein
VAPDKIVPPFKEFEFEYTSHKPGTATNLTYDFALTVPTDGSQPQVIDQLDILLAPGAKIDLGAVPACTASDETITAQGPVACPTRGRLGSGTASIWTGTGPLLHLDVSVFSTGHGVVVVLVSQGNVVAVIRGSLHRNHLTVTVPAITLGPGAQAAIVAFNLPLSGGTKRRPVFMTPSRCGPSGWTINYRPHFAQGKRVHLSYVTRCTP